MIVVAVTPLYPPKSRVGSWLATHELLADLAARGHDVSVYRRLSESNYYEHEGIRVFPGKSADVLDAAIANAHVVVSHCGDDGMAAFLANRHGKPSVRMAHGAHTDIAGRLDGSALAVFNSHALAAAAGWDGPQTVIHPPARADVHASPGTRVTLVNLTNVKGGALFWQLAKKLPKVKFLAVKGGWGVQPIYWRSNVTAQPVTERMARVYSQTRVLVMPSVEETFGLVGVEAMSCGIPVIAHPTPGLRESLGDAGIFVDRADVDGWVQAITALQDVRAWTEASARALIRAEELEAENSRAEFAAALEQVVPVAA